VLLLFYYYYKSTDLSDTLQKKHAAGALYKITKVMCLSVMFS